MQSKETSLSPSSAASPAVVMTSSSVALGEVTVRELAVVLGNLSFASLVEPFEKNGVSGKMVSRMKSHQTIFNMGKGQIEEIVAETFYEDFVVEWQKTGRIPRDLLQPAAQTPPTSSLKVLYVDYQI